MNIWGLIGSLREIYCCEDISISFDPTGKACVGRAWPRGSDSSPCLYFYLKECRGGGGGGGAWSKNLIVQRLHFASGLGSAAIYLPDPSLFRSVFLHGCLSVSSSLFMSL